MYWIRIDGTDVTPDLMETSTGKWFGDDDCKKGALLALRAEYERRRAAITENRASDSAVMDLAPTSHVQKFAPQQVKDLMPCAFLV